MHESKQKYLESTVYLSNFNMQGKGTLTNLDIDFSKMSQRLNWKNFTFSDKYQTIQEKYSFY